MNMITNPNTYIITLYLGPSSGILRPVATKSIRLFSKTDVA